MEKVKFGSKILELIVGNNPKLQKRTGALALATMLAGTPIIGTTRAEAETNGDRRAGISLVSQESTTFNMTLKDYEDGVIDAYLAISEHIDYPHLMADIQSAYYLVNYEYISDELEKELIAKKYITEVDMVNDEGKMSKNDNPEGWINTDNFDSLINAINNHNQKTIHLDYLANGIDGSHYVDYSVLCADEHDRADSHALFEKWYKAYNLKKDSLMGNDYYFEGYRQLTQINNGMSAGTFNGSIGYRHLVLEGQIYDYRQFLRDYSLNNYTDKELDVYFIPETVRSRLLDNRDDFPSNTKCPPELEIIATHMAQTKDFYKKGKAGLYSKLVEDEKRKDMAALEAEQVKSK